MAETIKWQTWAACGCLAARLKSRVRGAKPTAYRLHARSVCDAKHRDQTMEETLLPYAVMAHS